MTTYLGALSHGARTLVVHRRGRHIHWQTWTPDRQPPRHGDDWRVQAELRRDALDLRAAITRKEGP